MDDVTIQRTTTELVTAEQIGSDLVATEQVVIDTLTVEHDEPARETDAREADGRATAVRSRADRAGTLLAGVGIGAALMYFLDPDRGARRRHMLADQVASTLRSARRDARDALDDVRNRTRGLVAETRARLREKTVDDEQLVARVRAELGHRVEHARAIEVVADGGTVTLRGQVPAEERSDALAAVARVRGVGSVNDQLEAEARAES